MKICKKKILNVCNKNCSGIKNELVDWHTNPVKSNHKDGCVVACANPEWVDVDDNL